MKYSPEGLNHNENLDITDSQEYVDPWDMSDFLDEMNELVENLIFVLHRAM